MVPRHVAPVELNDWIQTLLSDSSSRPLHRYAAPVEIDVWTQTSFSDFWLMVMQQVPPVPAFGVESVLRLLRTLPGAPPHSRPPPVRAKRRTLRASARAKQLSRMPGNNTNEKSW